MKKFCCLLLALLLCIALGGCQKKNASATDTLPPLSEDEMEIIRAEEDNTTIYGEIIEKMSPDVLTLAVIGRRDVETWGETVYVITDKADEWCVGDYVNVEITEAERPHDTTQYVRIRAKEITPYDIPMPEKPILYFYPEEPTVCSTRITLNGELTCTYPAHGTDGWQNFTAYPDGTLIFPDGKEYYALYWEGLQYGAWDFSKGFCVRGEDTAAFLEWALAELGLTPREANEFIVYWLPRMQDNPYNVISFQTTAYTDGAVLEITPAPDSLLRVFMAYYPSDVEIDILPQDFDGFERQGFTVVEWGGAQASKQASRKSTAIQQKEPHHRCGSFLCNQ
ncbi:MAG: hypothetical protein IJW09_00705 [Clostridia bacterium]|nr:hypothetical protein [Clostridia bacterium]